MKRQPRGTRSRGKRWGSRPINSRLRGEALYKARGSCSNCGRSIEKDHVVLFVDYKIPLEQGGRTESDNLWAICEDCKVGKKSCFESVDSAWIRDVMALKSVHMRLGETLKTLRSHPVPAEIMDFVANQDDWKKRVRELRYLGWKIDVFTPKRSNRRVSTFYRLTEPRAWPDDPTGVIRRYELERAKRNRNR